MTVTISISSKGGFSLVEVLVAMMVMTVGLLGLLQSINVALQYNTRNHMREAAVILGEQTMNELRIKPFDTISTTATDGYAPMKVVRGVHGGQMKFVVERYAVPITADTSELQVKIKWAYKNVSSVHDVKTIKTREPDK